MKALWLVLVLALLGLAGAASSSVPTSEDLSSREQQKLVEEFLTLDEWTPTGRLRQAEILTALEGVPVLKASGVKSWKKRIEKLWDKAPELEKNAGTHYLYPDAEVKQARGKYVIGGNTKKPKGLLIAMHGGGVGSGDAEPMAAGYDGPAKNEDLVMIAPEVLEKTERGWTDSGTEEFVLQLIQRGLKTWDIDPNRVYLSGHSMGGYGSWTIGAHHADLCAGLAPSAGGPTPIMDHNGEWFDIVEGIVPNLRNVRMVVYQSADDPQVPPFANRLAVKRIDAAKERWQGYTEFEYWEVTGRGHDAPPGGYGALLEKITAARRNLWPAVVLWQPDLSWKRDFYWLHWDYPQREAVLEARVDPESNSISIEARGGTPEGLAVWLDERLLDLKEPVRVSLGKEVAFEGKVEPTLAALVASAARRDLEYLTAYRIELEN